MNSFENFKQEVEKAKAAIFGEIDNQIAEMEEGGDVEKFFDRGVKSAGGRLRKGLQNIRKAIHNPTIRATMNGIEQSAKDLREEIKG